MKYITIDDIRTVIQERMMQESIERDEKLLDSLEEMAISEVEAYIGARYDTKRIFADPPLRTGILVQALTQLVTVRALRRNAARKLPDSLQEMENWALSILVRIRDGIMPLPSDMPPLTDEKGNELAPIIHGRVRNDSWFF